MRKASPMNPNQNKYSEIAREILSHMSGETVQQTGWRIERALLTAVREERERCAKIAESWFNSSGTLNTTTMRHLIAKSIRNQPQDWRENERDKV